MEQLSDRIRELQQRLDRLKQKASTVDEWEAVTRLECKVLMLRSMGWRLRAA